MCLVHDRWSSCALTNVYPGHSPHFCALTNVYPGHSPHSSHPLGQRFSRSLNSRNIPLLLGSVVFAELHNASELSAIARQSSTVVTGVHSSLQDNADMVDNKSAKRTGVDTIFPAKSVRNDSLSLSKRFAMLSSSIGNPCNHNASRPSKSCLLYTSPSPRD